jgi:4-hydroxyacetophenone monooxygenase
VVVRRPDGAEETLRVNAVINAHGPVNRWKWPSIPGQDSFGGVMMHTAGWDPSVDLSGKRVAVIGTGASAGQLVPAIAGDVGSMVVFQRSKHWVIPNPEINAVVPEPVKWALRHIPHYREWFRFRVYWNGSDGLFVNVVKDPEWRSEVSVSRHNDALRRFALRHMEKKLADRPDLMEKLTPDFPIFAKRIIMDVGWYDALKQENVVLETGAVAAFTPTGVRMADGRTYDFDVVICATGFDVARMLGNLEVRGADGRSLNAEWGEDDPRAYLGMTIPGYPNFFFTVGPNSAPNHAAGHNLVAEAQVHYIVECLDLMSARKARAIEVKPEAFAEFNDRVDRRMPEMIWTHPKANSYYNNSKGRVFLSWPWRLVDYWSQTRAPDEDHYHLN